MNITYDDVNSIYVFFALNHMKVIFEKNYLSYCIIIKKRKGNEKKISNLHVTNDPRKYALLIYNIMLVINCNAVSVFVQLIL